MKIFIHHTMVAYIYYVRNAVHLINTLQTENIARLKHMPYTLSIDIFIHHKMIVEKKIQSKNKEKNN